MSSTELDRVAVNQAVSLFPGHTPDEIIRAATDVADRFSKIVKTQRMFQRIGTRDHILIEAWQTIGSLTGVFADEGDVRQLEWPDGLVEHLLSDTPEQPPRPGREPSSRSDERAAWEDADRAYRRWEHLDRLRWALDSGQAFGFVASYRASKTGGGGVGWAESRCTRAERSKVGQDDYQLSSMAQTRAQSRALAAPLRFVVKLAGYEGTPAEELESSDESNGGAGAVTPSAPPTLPWGPWADDEQERTAIEAIMRIDARVSDVDAIGFVLALGQHFQEGVPVAAVTAIKGLARFLSDFRAAHTSETTAKDVSSEARDVSDN